LETGLTGPVESLPIDAFCLLCVKVPDQNILESLSTCALTARKYNTHA
jgi:hypothetical protein